MQEFDFLLKISNYLKACSANYFSPEHGVPHSWSPPELLSGDAKGPQLQWRGRLCCSFTQSWRTLQLHGIQHNRLPISISWILLRLMSIEFVMPSNHLILCRPLLLLPSICLSVRVFSNESVLHIHVAKVLELQHRSFQWIFRADFL